MGFVSSQAARIYIYKKIGKVIANSSWASYVDIESALDIKLSHGCVGWESKK